MGVSQREENEMTVILKTTPRDDGAMEHETRNYTVGIHKCKTRGWFEHLLLGEDRGGGLWFDHRDGVMRLFDYDGTFELPLEVANALVDLGADVDKDFFP